MTGKPAAAPTPAMPNQLPSARELFRSAFGADAQRQRQEEREREAREREAWEALERRRQHFAAMRQSPDSGD